MTTKELKKIEKIIRSKWLEAVDVATEKVEKKDLYEATLIIEKENLRLARGDRKADSAEQPATRKNKGLTVLSGARKNTGT